MDGIHLTDESGKKWLNQDDDKAHVFSCLRLFVIYISTYISLLLCFFSSSVLFGIHFGLHTHMYVEHKIPNPNIFGSKIPDTQKHTRTHTPTQEIVLFSVRIYVMRYTRE